MRDCFNPTINSKQQFRYNKTIPKIGQVEVERIRAPLKSEKNFSLSPRSKGLIAGLIQGNQWLISPDHKL